MKHRCPPLLTKVVIRCFLNFVFSYSAKTFLSGPQHASSLPQVHAAAHALPRTRLGPDHRPEHGLLRRAECGRASGECAEQGATIITETHAIHKVTEVVVVWCRRGD